MIVQVLYICALGIPLARERDFAIEVVKDI